MTYVSTNRVLRSVRDIVLSPCLTGTCKRQLGRGWEFQKAQNHRMALSARDFRKIDRACTTTSTHRANRHRHKRNMGTTTNTAADVVSLESKRQTSDSTLPGQCVCHSWTLSSSCLVASKVLQLAGNVAGVSWIRTRRATRRIRLGACGGVLGNDACAIFIVSPPPRR